MPDELDRALDEALSAYAAAPDRPGLEQRVLAQARYRVRARMAFALAAAAVLAGLMLLSPLRLRPPAPQTQPSIAELPSPATAPVVVAAVAKPSRRVIRVRHVKPKRREFPTPSPLTLEERALVEIVRSQPALIATLNRPLEPLRTAPLQIEPLDKGEK